MCQKLSFSEIWGKFGILLGPKTQKFCDYSVSTPRNSVPKSKNSVFQKFRWRGWRDMCTKKKPGCTSKIFNSVGWLGNTSFKVLMLYQTATDCVHYSCVFTHQSTNSSCCPSDNNRFSFLRLANAKEPKVGSDSWHSAGPKQQ